MTKEIVLAMDEILEEIEYPDSPLSYERPSDEDDDESDFDEFALKSSNETLMIIDNEILQQDKHIHTREHEQQLEEKQQEESSRQEIQGAQESEKRNKQQEESQDNHESPEQKKLQKESRDEQELREYENEKLLEESQTQQVLSERENNEMLDESCPQQELREQENKEMLKESCPQREFREQEYYVTSDELRPQQELQVQEESRENVPQQELQLKQESQEQEELHEKSQSNEQEEGSQGEQKTQEQEVPQIETREHRTDNESRGEECQEATRTSALTKQIADILLSIKNLYYLLKKQRHIEHQVSELETEWYFKSINNEHTVTSADKTDWVLLNAELEEVKSQKIDVENELAVKNVEDILKSTFNTRDHKRLKNMLELVFSMEKFNNFASKERKELQVKVRKLKFKDSEILRGQVSQSIDAVQKERGICEQPSEFENSSVIRNSKRSTPSSSFSEDTAPPLKKLKIEQQNPPLTEIITESTAEPSTEQEIGPYWSYIASIMQCLRSTLNIKQYLIDNDYFSVAKRTAYNARNAIPIKVLKAIWGEEPACSVTRKEAILLIEHFNLQSTTFRQRDAYEFFVLLLNALHRFLAKPITSHLGSVPLREVAWLKALRNSPSIISDLFYGQYRITENHCRICRHHNVSYEIFKCITLPLTNLKSCDLHVRLGWLFKEKKKLLNCVNCGVLVEAKRKIDLVKVPPIVVIRLDRFENAGFARKNNAVVNFPLKSLNMDQFLVHDSDIPRDINVRYKLYAITCHDGKLDGGRYIVNCQDSTIIRNPRKIWFKHDNGQCSTGGTGRAIQTVTSYLLYYVKNAK